MAKLTPAQKQRAQGIKRVRQAEMRLAKKDAQKKAPAPQKKDQARTKGITNVIKKRAGQANRVFAKASRGK